METVVQKRKLHPHKFAMWIAMASISMMFAGLTSFYIARESQGNWSHYQMPVLFTISTVTILLSSITMILSVKAFKNRMMPRYRKLLLTTLVLGILFCVMQCAGFATLYRSNIRMNGNVSGSIFFVIAGLHLLHIAGGIIALLISYFKALRTQIKVYSATGIEVVAAYWHFVDVLWIYLFVFFLANQ